jgi:hypothetical protein
VRIGFEEEYSIGRSESTCEEEACMQTIANGDAVEKLACRR